MAEKFIQPSTNPNSIPFYSHLGAPSEIPLPANKDSWLAYVHAIGEENEQFKNQQKWIQTEMTKLSKLSQNLYRQNQQLRSLYRGRTQDISKFLTTMAINANETTIEHQHSQFLLKELNYFILKQIKANATLSKELTQSIREKAQKANQLNQLRMRIQQQQLGQLKVKIRVDFKTSQLKDLKSNQILQISQADVLEGSVYELRIGNKQLELQIQQLLNQKQVDYGDIKAEKRQYENNYEQLMIENKKYKNQIVKDKIDLERVELLLTTKKEKYHAVVKALGVQMRNYQQNQQKNQQLLTQKEKLKAKIQQARNRANSLKTRLELAKQQKHEILEKIEAVRARMRQSQVKNNRVLDQIWQTQTEKSCEIKNNLKKNTKKADEQLKLIQEQKNKVEKAHEIARQEERISREKNEKYIHLIKTISNPVNQIDKMELMTRLRKVR